MNSSESLQQELLRVAQRYGLPDVRGKVVLIVNTASACRQATQLLELELLFRHYDKQGFLVLGFPSNQFKQEPIADDKLVETYWQRFHVTFPIVPHKFILNGEHTHPLFRQLKSMASGIFGTQAIKWNYTKFLLGRDCATVQRISPFYLPNTLVVAVDKAINQTPSVRRLKKL